MQVAQAFLLAVSPTFLLADALEPSRTRTPAGWKTCDTADKNVRATDFARRAEAVIDGSPDRYRYRPVVRALSSVLICVHLWFFC
jgi:hypothetical protein